MLDGLALDFSLPFSLDFDLVSGLSSRRLSTKRRISDMRRMFFDESARLELECAEDPLVYEFYELGTPEDSGDISFGTSIVYPGRVGSEYFMTKGHFHTVLDTGETYLCLQGHGYMLLENPEGEWSAQELRPGTSVYCPKRYAHRSVNTGETPLVTFFAFRGDAGHDYGSIETKGYRKLILERNERPLVVDNPRWGSLKEMGSIY